MATFVLVHGSWGGGWIWAKVRPALEAQGHRVLAPSLTGLGDRSHLRGPDVGLHTHITDIANLLEWEDVDDAILVGHSYGGMVISGVCATVPDRVGGVVYLDAFAPRTGQSAFELLPFVRQLMGGLRRPDGAIEPADFATLFGISDAEDLRWLAAKGTALPWNTHAETLPAGSEEVLARVPVTYVHCSGQDFFDETAANAAERGFRMVSWPDTGHLVQVTHPERVVALLVELAGTPAPVDARRH
ncbi:alpha/beta fold hydrolase [Pseudonocardia sp. ICBG1293]|uniref:alpha/beta fold hydrolase n=1 Tax=Pseudonocardia sp. ICBG1293 TaxID=2844382 RepID=UPI001CCA421B|nr:alpha/beta fold hydrolase [Pseudonocardia sp. ICBG1293]